ncbi:MAG: cellulase family glycosylhydrolase [Candidatus Symbiothrix sp.]|jgi:endoglucanase|nr:cellulase family glycosylhydrolase [Candidatus Symbiothrix sp.]
MKKRKIMYSILLCLFFSLFPQACSDEKATPELVVRTESLDFDKEGGTKNFLVESNGNWTASVSDNTWITADPASGKATSKVLITVGPNTGENAREGLVTFSLGSLQKTTKINQPGQGAAVPPDDNEGMVSDAKDLAAQLKIGWNLGNSLEATSETNASETMWGNPKTSKRLIDAVKAAGFNAIRIPCAWSGYIENQETYKISDAWLARVKEVVDYCIDNEMYTIINIHWDRGWLEENPFYAKQEEVNKKQKALWTQIAGFFKDYDEHLLLAGTNEVHAGYGTPSAENIAVQSSYNQTFVDAVRATGGKNAWRNLVVQAYNTNSEYAIKYLKMPEDKAKKRLMVEVHYYDPWDFCGDESSSIYLWGKDYSGKGVSTWGQEAYANERFAGMKTNFVDKGIPVILGEYGAILRSKLSDLEEQEHIQARNYYLNYITKTAQENGCIPFYWDNGNTGNNGFGLFNRSTGAQVYPDAIQAIVSAK